MNVTQEKPFFAVFLFFVLHSFYQRLNQMAIIAPFDLT